MKVKTLVCNKRFIYLNHMVWCDNFFSDRRDHCIVYHPFEVLGRRKHEFFLSRRYHNLYCNYSKLTIYSNDHQRDLYVSKNEFELIIF